MGQYILIDKFINKIEIIMGKGKDANDVEWMLYKVKKLKNKLIGVWIKNYNIKTNFANLKLLLITNLMYVILTNILFMLNKWHQINIFSGKENVRNT
jgi:hypothetical protein